MSKVFSIDANIIVHEETDIETFKKELREWIETQGYSYGGSVSDITKPEWWDEKKYGEYSLERLNHIIMNNE